MPHPEAASPKRPRPAAPGGPGFDPRVPPEAAARRVSSREDGDFYSTSAAFIGPLLRPPGRTGSRGSTAGSTAPSGDAAGGLDAELRQFYREIEELEHHGEDLRGSPGPPDPLRAPPGPWEHPDPVSTVSPAPTATILDWEHHRGSHRCSPGPPDPLRAPHGHGDPLRAPPGPWEHPYLVSTVSTAPTAAILDGEHHRDEHRCSLGHTSVLPEPPDLVRAPHGHGDPLRAPPSPWEHPDPVSTPPTAALLDGEHHRDEHRCSLGPPDLVRAPHGHGDPLRAPLSPWEHPDPVFTAPTAALPDGEHHREHRDPGGQKLLILLRGLPGSGKTTLSRALLGRSRGAGVVCSADDYFRDGGGYRYRVSRLGDAHGWSQSRARRAMAEGRSPVIIDNTNTQAWEMRPYVEMAIGEGYRVEFQEPETWWKFDPEELEKRNQHGVSRKKIAQMLARYEFRVSISMVMNSVEPDRPLPARPGPRNPPSVHPGSGDLLGDRPG